MVLELKLRKVGNAVGVILPEEALAHLKAGTGDMVSLTDGPDGSLRLSPSTSEVARQTRVALNLMKRYRHTVRDLAK